MLLQLPLRDHTRSCVRRYLAMFETNVTLLKIVWRLESRQSFRLTK